MLCRAMAVTSTTSGAAVTPPPLLASWLVAFPFAPLS